MKKLKIFIIEESPFFLRWFRKLILPLPSMHIIGEAKDPINALKCLHRLKPDAVIMDMNTQLRFGIDLVRSIRAITPVPKLIVLTSEHYDAYQRKAFYKVDFLIDKLTEYHRIPEILKGFAVQNGYRPA